MLAKLCQNHSHTPQGNLPEREIERASESSHTICMTDKYVRKPRIDNIDVAALGTVAIAEGQTDHSSEINYKLFLIIQLVNNVCYSVTKCCYSQLRFKPYLEELDPLDWVFKKVFGEFEEVFFQLMHLCIIIL